MRLLGLILAFLPPPTHSPRPPMLVVEVPAPAYGIVAPLPPPRRQLPATRLVQPPAQAVQPVQPTGHYERRCGPNGCSWVWVWDRQSAQGGTR